MEYVKSKALRPFIFISLSVLIFMRPFFSGLAYPTLEIYYQNSIIFLGIITLFFAKMKTHAPSLHVRGRASNMRCLLPISLLLLAYIISTLSSINIQNSINETTKFIGYFSIFFMVSQTDLRQRKSLIKTIVVTASIISLYSIYQYLWGYQETIDYLSKINSDFLSTSSYAKDILISKRAIATFPSPNIFGSYLIIAIFLSLFLLKEIRGPKIWYLSPILITISLVLTKSLGAWLSIMSCFIILFLLSYNSIKYKKVTVSLFLISIALIISFILFTRHERLLDLNNPLNSITQRIDYWRTAMAMIRDHPILGIGPGNFHELFLDYKVGMSTNTRYAHNLFLHQWSETGLLGFIGLIFLTVTFITKSFSKSKYLFLAGLGFIFHNLLDNAYFIPQAGLFWWILLGLVMDVFNNASGSRQSSPS